MICSWPHQCEGLSKPALHVSSFPGQHTFHFVTHRLFLPTRHGQREPPCSLSLQRTTKKAEVGRQDRRGALEAGQVNRREGSSTTRGSGQQSPPLLPVSAGHALCSLHRDLCQVKRPYSFTQRHLRTRSQRTEASRTHGWEVRLLTPPCHRASHLRHCSPGRGEARAGRLSRQVLRELQLKGLALLG